MAQPSNKPLQQNPFITMRDPETGRWLVLNNPDNTDEVFHDSGLSINTISVTEHDAPILS
ncbi:MAG: hypothetical protein F6K09_34115 [Merismopedia sp. SIO2A8]|nr:hypothetical protein [Merismopedia sp. SIO2A8]